MSAAVAVIEVLDHEPAVLLIRRALRADDPWSGQWALPGGRRQVGDSDDLATCLREVQEEIGLALTPTDSHGALPVAEAGRHAGMAVAVTPFLFRLARRPALQPNPYEVAHLHWCPLAVLRDITRHGQAVLGHDARLRPMLPLDDYPLWGLTYRVLCRHLGIPVASDY